MPNVEDMSEINKAMGDAADRMSRAEAMPPGPDREAALAEAGREIMAIRDRMNRLFTSMKSNHPGGSA